MALIFNLKAIEHVSGKNALMAKSTFRGFVQSTKPVTPFNDTVYYGETLQWPLGRPLEKDEFITVQVFIKYQAMLNKYKSKKLYGTFSMSLQGILEQYNIKGSECLLDLNSQVMDARLTFELHYMPPDGGDMMWDPDEFNYPLLDQWTDSPDQVDGVTKQRAKTIEEMLEEIENEENDNMDPSDIMRQIEKMHSQEGEAQSSSSEDDGEELVDEFTPLAAKSGDVPSKLDPTLDKMQDYQVSITLETARSAEKFPIGPEIHIEVEGSVEKTEIECEEAEGDPSTVLARMDDSLVFHIFK